MFKLRDMDLPNKQYKCILADPPWDVSMINPYKERLQRPDKLPYPAMSLQEIIDLPIIDMADSGCHLWLWTTNGYLHDAFHVMGAWGFKYLNTITWVKKSGIGAWFVNTTQHLLFGYKERCEFHKEKYAPTHLITKPPTVHSQKPFVFYSLIESISDSPKVELFARDKREGWDAWGNQVPNHCQKLLTKEDA